MYLPLNAKDQTVSWKMQVDLPSNSRDFQISVHKFLPNQFIGKNYRQCLFKIFSYFLWAIYLL